MVTSTLKYFLKNLIVALNVRCVNQNVVHDHFNTTDVTSRSVITR